MFNPTLTMYSTYYFGIKDNSNSLGCEGPSKDYIQPPVSENIKELLYELSDSWKGPGGMSLLIPELLNYLGNEWRNAKDSAELKKHIIFIINLFEKHKSNGEYNSRKVLQYMLNAYKFRIYDQELKIRIQKYLGTYKPLIEPPKEDTSVGFVSMDTYDVSDESEDEIEEENISQQDEYINDEDEDDYPDEDDLTTSKML